jgi:ethanolamine utilization protein EutA
LSRDLKSHVPDNQGRATVYGLTIHNTELSGSTLFLPRPELLPLCDLPLLGKLTWDPQQCDEFNAHLKSMLQLAARRPEGACLAIDCGSDGHGNIKQLGKCFAGTLELVRFPSEVPLVLLVTSNIGKTLGQYATRWGQSGLNLIVLDEIPDRSACFVTLGRPCDNSVPLSFYGVPPQASSRGPGIK